MYNSYYMYNRRSILNRENMRRNFSTTFSNFNNLFRNNTNLRQNISDTETNIDVETKEKKPNFSTNSTKKDVEDKSTNSILLNFENDEKKDNIPIDNDKQDHEKCNEENSRIDQKDDRVFSFGPIEVFNDRVSFFGNCFSLDNLIILGVAAFLIFENSNDYILIIILGMMLFDIRLNTITDILPIKSLKLFF